MDAHPDHRYILPGPSIWPFFLAVTGTLGLAGSVFQMWWAVVGGMLSFVPLVAWFWPRRVDYDVLIAGERE